ncbi:MAG TPA: hypothetical protein VGH96_22620 [Streptosporangiaceae bacterium]
MDSVSSDAGRIAVEDGRPAGRLVDLRAAGRDFDAAERGRDTAGFGLAVAAFGLAALCGLAAVRAADAVVLGWVVLARADVPAALVPLADVARVEVLRADVARADVARVDGRVEDALGLADGLRALAVRGVAAARRAGLAATGLADDIVLAATVSAFAAVIMALVAVFIDFMAVDIVCADAVALVAAAVILVAADVTLVAAEDTVLAAVAGVAELRPLRLAVLPRAALARGAVEREAVDRDAVLRVDREAVLRVVVRAAVPLAGFAALLRVVLGVALDVLELELDGRLVVLLDALRPTDLLRAVLAGLRRVAARVVD